MSEELATTQPSEISAWSGAARRGAVSRKERQAIIQDVLIDGEDYGVIPGTGSKPALLQPGAQAISDCLNCWPDFVLETREMNHETGWVYYRVKCIIRQRGTDLAMAAGWGSCNSFEAKYRMVTPKLICPNCGQTTLLKSKYEPEYFCWEKKGGCGFKFPFTEEMITSQSLTPVARPAEELLAQDNTILKIGCKRAHVSGSMSLGFSRNFTQDVEDMPIAGAQQHEVLDQVAKEAKGVREFEQKQEEALANPGEPQTLPDKPPPEEQKSHRFANCHMGHANMKGQPFSEQKPDDQMWYLSKLHDGAIDPDNKYRRANAQRLEFLVNWAMRQSGTDIDPVILKKIGDIAADRAVVEALAS